MMDIDELIKQRLRERGYNIQRELGRGGYGITYLTTAPSHPNLVVIKTIKNDLLQSLKSDISALDSLNKILKSFKNEANTLLNLEHQHPNIVKFIEIFSENLELQIDNVSSNPIGNVYSLELRFLVVEYIEGENLKQLLHRKSSFLSEEEALSYVKQIGKALAVIHQKNVLHRDIKPENIMVCKKTNNAVLIDFGIAREFTPEITQSHTVAFTDPYAPPEQLRRKDKRGCYTDIYSLAATLYYLLTKQRPTSASERKYDEEPLKEPQTINPNISDRVNQEILWGMELEPSNRPQTVEDWLEKLLPSYLSSEKGVDYTRLRDFLKAGQWKEADEETLAVMLKATGREKEGWLSSESLKNFPCTDLATIDKLWVKYSGGRFGFSVQKRIWESVGKDYEKFGGRVGWRKGWLWMNKMWVYKNVTFDTSAPPGHLPTGGAGGVGPGRVSSLASRLVNCNL
ncbi:MAG: serine/threonine-protein kinase [Scytonema sp. PMC 1069.18]|nr:serine/threonine-protein kinase [Scytonema sp. PMC 1069.18]MEC4888281.1 serine/threonine-protein kinase [Scytonema sp. PMC 1070.18]